MEINIAPSILSAEFGNMNEEIAKVAEAGAKWIHLDVMDGHFVSNITFGPPVIATLQKPVGCIFDAHLMISNPERYIEDFAKAGVDTISIHAESTNHLHGAVQMIKNCGKKTCVALNPGTSLSALDWVLEDLDMVLIMSVNPGFSGQSYIPAITQKIAELNYKLSDLGLDIPIQVDGGVNVNTITEVIGAGATNFVAGSAVFKGEKTVANYKNNIDLVMNKANTSLYARKKII